MNAKKDHQVTMTTNIKSQHTLGELRVNVWTTRRRTLEVAGGLVIAEVHQTHKEHELAANAEHLALCWNTHVQLREALQMAANVLEIQNKASGKMNANVSILEARVGEIRAAFLAARAAVAKCEVHYGLHRNEGTTACKG